MKFQLQCKSLLCESCQLQIALTFSSVIRIRWNVFESVISTFQNIKNRMLETFRHHFVFIDPPQDSTSITMFTYPSAPREGSHCLSGTTFCPWFHPNSMRRGDRRKLHVDPPRVLPDLISTGPLLSACRAPRARCIHRKNWVILPCLLELDDWKFWVSPCPCAKRFYDQNGQQFSDLPRFFLGDRLGHGSIRGYPHRPP